VKNYISKIKELLKFLFLSKWVFLLPQKKTFLLVDGLYNPFLKYFDKKNFNIIYRRGESINIRVILKCVLNFNISSLNYYRQYIKFASPKIIFTAFDYHPIFYRLSRLSSAKTFMLQKGHRSKCDSIMYDKNLINKSQKKDNFVDYIFLYNKFTSDFYRKYIKGEYLNTGSFENNFDKIKLSKQKKEILYVSNFKIDKNKKLLSNCENDEKLIYNLHKLAVSQKIKFNVLPRQKGKKESLDEYIFFKNLLKTNFSFIEKKESSSSYKIIITYKYVFCSYSTLGREFLSKGGRVGFLFFKSKNNPSIHFRFGSLEKLPKKGYFWTTDVKFNLNELKRVFNFVIKVNDKIWKIKSQPTANKTLQYDYDNKLFRSIVSKELKKKNN